jgi:endonuclease/exonuclease/phosphatase family metal-dependent hydrolase
MRRGAARHRRSGPPAAALLLAGCLTATGGSLAAGAEPGPPLRPLRYVTFNLLHGGASSGLVGSGQDLDRRLDMAADGLRALDPDVIGLQEASVGHGRGNVARRLADRLAFHYVHALATIRLFGNGFLDRVAIGTMNFAEGPAILSRYPIVAWQTWDLPRCATFFDPRVLLYAVIATPWGQLGAFSTHISGEPCQARRITELVGSRRARLPVVLMGDFNAVEESAAIGALRNGGGLVDAFRAANPTAPGPTVWQKVDVPHPMARRRVDYVFVAPGHAVPGQVRASRVVLNAPGRLPDGRVLWPSDHYGVLAEVGVLPVPAPVPRQADR